MDLLSQVLASLRIESTSISRWRLSAPWGVDVSRFEPGFCLRIISGSLCWQGEDSRPIWLHAGDTLLTLRGSKGQLRSELGTRCTAIHELPWQGDSYTGLGANRQPSSAQQLQWGGGGEACELLGLAFTFQYSSSVQLLSSLPEIIVLPQGQAPAAPFFTSAINHLMDDHQPGYQAVAGQLSELVVLSLLREVMLTTNSAASGWLKGLQDRHIHPALLAIHNTPQQPWTLTNLAQQAKLSRSAFAARFKRIVGMGPVEYLSRWRIQIACDHLRNSSDSVEQIAAQTGFGNDRTLRRVFKQQLGISPRDYRRHYRAGS